MLYKLNRDDIESSRRIEIRNPAGFGLREKDIENFLKHHLAEVVSEEHLMLIGQERSFQEEADLLALDEKGTLYIFELKRWKTNQENILQVMRYCQIFGRYTYERLNDLARREGIEDLKKQHGEYFELDSELKEGDFNKDQVLVLITSGMDAATISAIEFWSNKGVHIKCAPYRIYNIDEIPYIQFDTYNPYGEVFAEENSDYYIVNTNKTYDPDAWKDMIGDGINGKASAYGGNKHMVTRISKESIVYLYHTGHGVIAKGIATSDFQRTDYHGNVDAEFYVPLKFEWALGQEEWKEKAPTARQINRKLHTSHRFRLTVFAITENMSGEIDDIFKEMSP